MILVVSFVTNDPFSIWTFPLNTKISADILAQVVHSSFYISLGNISFHEYIREIKNNLIGWYIQSSNYSFFKVKLPVRANESHFSDRL